MEARQKGVEFCSLTCKERKRERLRELVIQGRSKLNNPRKERGVEGGREDGREGTCFLLQ